MKNLTVNVVGGGLAGSEAAWQCLNLGAKVKLYEMRPNKSTEAHKTGDLAELVCSNSLKAMDVNTASGLLKYEMSKLDSLIVAAAYEAKVPAGGALAVDRLVFSKYIMDKLKSFDSFELVNEEVVKIPSEQELIDSDEAWIVATGPLTTEGLTNFLNDLIDGEKRLHFYDAIAPVIDAETINFDEVFRANRWDESEGGDYLNIPLDKEQYDEFIKDVSEAEKMPLHSFEKIKYFESCLPIEVMIERGKDTLRFGPMKPVGLTNPKTGSRPWANIQLRMETVQGSMFSMVGFQTKMKWPEQKRIFRKLPGLANAEFFKLGSIHRNTYLNSPKVLNSDFSFKNNSRVFLAGQVSGVEGYTESASMGLIAGRSAMGKLLNKPFKLPPVDTIIGALADYVVHGSLGDFLPMNSNLGLLPTIPKTRGVSKKERKAMQAERSRDRFNNYFGEL